MGNAGRNSDQGFWFQMVDAGQQLNGGTVSYPWHDEQGQAANKIAYLKSISSWGWIVGSGMLINDIDNAVKRDVLNILLTTLAAILLMSVFGLLITRTIIGPLDAIKEIMQTISQGNLTVKVPNLGNDEIGLVAQHINQSIQAIREALYESVIS